MYEIYKIHNVILCQIQYLMLHKIFFSFLECILPMTQSREGKEQPFPGGLFKHLLGDSMQDPHCFTNTTSAVQQ